MKLYRIRQCWDNVGQRQTYTAYVGAPDAVTALKLFIAEHGEQDSISIEREDTKYLYGTMFGTIKGATTAE